MLQALREKSSGWIATVILGLLVIPFAFFGMEQYLFQRSETFAAKIEAPPTWWRTAPDWWVVRKAFWQKEEISVDDFRSAFERVRQSQRASAGENFNVSEFESIDNKRRILELLVDERVMRMSTDREGFAIGDAQVRKAIESIPDFQVDGKFDLQRYRLMLASRAPPMTATQFDDQIREDLKQQMLTRQLQGSAFVTNAEGQRLIALLGEKRDVSFAVLPTPPADTAPVAAAEIASWYKAHPQDFRSPEMVTIEYVDIDGAALPLPAAIDENSLKTQYEQDKARFVEPEQRLTSHILVKVDAAADAAARKAAEAKAQDILKKVKAAGADFAALARQYSEDEGSKDGGGDLGWIAKNGQMIKPFEDAVFATAAGTISGPTKTDFGWHIIQVREMKPGHEKPFEDARPELERMLAETARERAFNDLTGTLVDEVLKSPTTLAPAARAANLPVQKLGPFARGQATGIAANPAVIRAAFSEDLKQNRQVSDPIEIAPNHSVLIRVVEHTPDRVQPLDKVGPQVVAAVRADRARKAIEAEGEAVLARLKKGESLATIANEKKWIVTNMPGMQRGAPMPSADANEAYFQVSPPAAGKRSPGKVLSQDGQMVVFEVTKVAQGDNSEITPEIRANFLRELAPRIGEQDALSVGKAERKRMKVQFAEDRL
ncbi:MAG: peptidylprolyl isomerase [Lysobacter sp.]|nr:peptidylprolyl isomerase [Lysobacter sp.]